MITENEKYNYILARGFLKRIKEAMESGIYPDMERGEKLVEKFEFDSNLCCLDFSGKTIPV